MRRPLYPQKARADTSSGAKVCISVDIDAVAGWLGSYHGEDSVSDISRGLFAGTVGVRRLLRLFAKYNITTTWFVPGHSLETFPEECGLVRDAGHELGLHGYSHENPNAMTLAQQTAIMDKTYKLLTDFCGGKPPRGIVAPWWGERLPLAGMPALELTVRDRNKQGGGGARPEIRTGL